jgi:hypothetical protein
LGGPNPGSGRETLVTDLHLRILQMVATQRRRELDDDSAADHASRASAERRRDVERVAGQTGANLAAAEARRRRPRPGRAR